MKLLLVEYIKACTQIEDCPREGLPEIAFIGRSNVGKSSLINLLLGRKAAYVSKTPGKTRLIHFFKVNHAFYLVDLPGYGYARALQTMRKQWGPMMDSYLLQRKQLRGIVFLIDIRHPATPLDLQMKRWLDHYQITTLFVAAKGDKVEWGKRKKQLDEIKRSFEVFDLIVTSIRTNEGKEALWKGIEGLLSKGG